MSPETEEEEVNEDAPRSISDITQSDGENGRIRFSANTTQADNWMRQNYGGHTIDREREDALSFKEQAEENGLSITPL